MPGGSGAQGKLKKKEGTDQVKGPEKAHKKKDLQLTSKKGKGQGERPDKSKLTEKEGQKGKGKARGKSKGETAMAKTARRKLQDEKMTGKGRRFALNKKQKQEHRISYLTTLHT